MSFFNIFEVFLFRVFSRAPAAAQETSSSRFRERNSTQGIQKAHFTITASCFLFEII